MAKLLVSRVNGIKIIQVGESKLSIENKSEDGGKVGVGRKIGFAGGGANKTIDLGKGKKKHSLRIYAFNRSENDALFKIFYEERYCTIVDKFKGKIKVYIDSIDITDSDKHVNRTIFDISCTVQDADFSPSINFAVMLASMVRGMEVEIESMVGDLAGMVGNVDTVFDDKTGVFQFVDSALEMLRGGINSILDVKASVYGAYRQIKSRINTAERLFESIKSIKDVPSELSGLLKGVTEMPNIKTTPRSNNAVTGATSEFLRVGKSEVVPVVEPMVRGVVVSKVNVSEISQFEAEEMVKEVVASRIVNKVKAVRDIKSVLVGGFSNKNDFDVTINQTIERMRHLGYSEEEVSDKVYLLKSFANEQNYMSIIDVEVKGNKPLTDIVYERYGNLDNLANIEAMNALKDNDYISGKVKVFA